MKKAKWIYVVLIVLCAAAFMSYRILDGIREDTQPPKIKVDGQLTLSVLDPREKMLEGVTAMDNRDGDVTASVVVESILMTEKESTVKVVYAAFDHAGNVAKTEREVVFSDYRPPRFYLSGPMVYPVSATFDVLSSITAEDDLDGDISRSIRVTPMSEESIGTQGVHDVKFRVTNSMGDSTELVLPVEVYPAESYRAYLKLTDYLVYLAPGSAFNAKDYLYEFELFNDTTYLRGTFPEELTLKIRGEVNTNVPGVYPVSYTVTGEHLNETYAAYSKLIVVVEG